jgi:hypothetical protein
MFTHRHYEFVAGLLKGEFEYSIQIHDDGAALAVRRMACQFAEKFSADNSGFNSQRFYDACGMGR